MRRSAGHNATLIILLGIVTILLQFGTYYFLHSAVLTIAASVIIVALCCHILLEQSVNFDSCFSYSLFNIFLCFIIILLSYLGNSTVFPYESFLLLSIIFNWLIPTVFCILRALMDESGKYSHFATFYRNISIVFLIVYAGIFLYVLFLHNEEFILYSSDWKTFNYMPFVTLTTLIEDFITGTVALQTMILYIGGMILLFIPYGFYSALLLRYKSRLLRFSVLLLFPVCIELLQFILSAGKADTDHMILGILGVIVGAVCYAILNKLFQRFTDEDFLHRQSRYSFYKNPLHF